MTEKTDRELLYSAAKACGFVVLDWIDRYGDYYSSGFHGLIIRDGFSNEKEWNPLTDDGDAMRLACQLQFDLLLGHSGATVTLPGKKMIQELCHQDSGENLACTRRAIVRAAAAMGEAMQ